MELVSLCTNIEDFKYLVVGILKPTGEIIDELIITPLESIWNVHHDEYKRDHLT